ncbi:energy-coupling factor transporter transmembrane component T family protein [Thermoanaerobacterium thermosaccharolyticum]|uniref:energy-coupling factor transporter transmembrane component T family protein n=1 Tax=Thermoanaerobacterium thermosaccharolyticum TaxID=1517 RepID=UPI0010449E87|nr:energy-coupling factor transporter transmembrane component T [Thermoanaerobacterium thermosaccharolyticum]MBE0068855.1 energy-coupling factor transporter transmembrane protein EcfT [Thermoanaerobacterium thermosaccharolyticum]MBE0228733.1 energy-coupling factor transporter transmembrane protein EcfT [Thermoanaerobacterium thermosaccharolyticum]MCP2241061.1 energy-coupling factor transport system permease protein [Thermoanaerobacterium thermosaccharolyticum]TCW42394.1 energy-coupling factor t
MLKNITIGQYIPGDTFIHRLDPRVKIILSIIFIISLFIITKFSGYVFISLFILGSIYISKIPLGYIFKGLKPILVILILTVGLNIFFTPGGILLASIGPLKITSNGVRLALFMGLRLIFLIVGTSLLTLTTSPIALTDGIESLLNPFRRIGMPAHELAMMMTIALRFIPTLLEETDKIMKAQIARGADFESGNLMKRAKNLIPLLVPLFISAFRRADELAVAMEARCYRGGFNRTKLKQLKVTTIDYIAILVTSILVIILIWNRFWPW